MLPSSRRKVVLVTGASSGIGKAIALRFARAQYDVVLTSRSASALEATAQECRAFGVTATPVASDLSHLEGSKALLAEIKAKGLSVEILVNNAGFGIHGAFLSTDSHQEWELITLQLGSLIFLTKGLLPAMVERGEGKIINVASVYAFASAPRQSVYSACKSFIRTFSAALRTELLETGVSVTAVYPGITSTEFRVRAGMKEKKTKLSVTSEEVAEVTFRGAMANQLTVVPGFFNRLFVLIARHLPDEWLGSAVRFINKKRGIEHC